MDRKRINIHSNSLRVDDQRPNTLVKLNCLKARPNTMDELNVFKLH